MKKLRFPRVHHAFVKTAIVALSSVFLFNSQISAQEKETQIIISNPSKTKEDQLMREEGWRRFFSQRLEYNVSHRFTTPVIIDIYRKSELERVLYSDIGAKHARSAVKKSAEQAFREEIRDTLGYAWTEENIIEPVEEFVEEYIIYPAVKILTYPFKRIRKHVNLKLSIDSKSLIQDALSGREERNQLINPLNNEGIPGEEHYQLSHLPKKIAFGIRPFQNSPYGYTTVKFGDLYTQLRLSARDMLSKPSLNEASLLFQTKMSPHEIILSFGGVNPFKNEKELERYFGPHAFVGLSKILHKERGNYFEAYLEARAGENQNLFLGVNYRY